jgi:hypothetical protein
MAVHALHLDEEDSERRIHSGASDMGGSAYARGGVLPFAHTPPIR